MSLSRFNLSRSATTNIYTKDFRHLLPFPRHWLKRTSPKDPVIRSVPVKDRIKFWNIVPGDQIGIRGDETRRIHEVLSVNKVSNTVFLRGQKDGQQPVGVLDKPPKSICVPYSQCQLFVGTFEYGDTEDKSDWRPVFVRRIGMSRPWYVRRFRRWMWHRFAKATVPSLPKWYKSKHKEKPLVMPWPKQERPEPPKPSLYDVSEDVANEITYELPLFPPRNSNNPPELPEESTYVNSLFNPQPVEIDPSQPYEIHLYRELSNPHSRAKKQARWKARQEYRRDLLVQMIADEMKTPKGRSRGECRAEATFKWRRQIEAETKADKKRRSASAYTLYARERKRLRKLKRKEKKIEKLSRMVLTEAPNQVIPGSMPVPRRTTF